MKGRGEVEMERLMDGFGDVGPTQAGYIFIKSL